MGNSQ